MKRAGRKLLIFLGLLSLLLLIAAVVVQIILLTDKPGLWVLDALSENLGIQVSADDFSTTWSGRTRLRGLSAKRPLEEDPFLVAETLELNHNSLISLALTRRFRLDAVRAEDGRLYLRQNEAGRWNIEDLIDRFRDDGESDEPLTELSLPDMEGRDLRVIVVEQGGRQTTVGPLAVDADAGDLTWTLALEIPSVLSLHGRLTTVRPFTHEFTLHLRNLDEVTDLNLYNPEILADWNGRYTEDALDGRLRLDRAEMADVTLRGDARLRAASGRLELTAGDMTIRDGRLFGFPVFITGGALDYADRQLTVTDLAVEAMGVSAALSGLWDIPGARVQTEGRWFGSASGSPARHSGSWQGSVRYSPDGYKSVEMNLRGEYEDDADRIRAQLDLSGSGADWTRSLWTLEAAPLAWHGPDRSLELGPARLEVAVDWPVVRLNEISAANVRRLEARGRYAADTDTWQLNVDADRIRLDTAEEADPPVDLTLRAAGTAKTISVEQLELSRNGLRLAAASDITLPYGWVENGHVTLSGSLPQYDPGSPLRKFSASPWQVNTVLNGTLFPADLNVNGQMKVREPAVDPNVTDTLDIPFELRLTREQAALKTASFLSDRGSWYFHGFYNFIEESGRLFIDLESIPLDLLSDYFSSAAYQGTLSGSLTADFPSPDLRHLDLNGSWNLQDFHGATFAAEKVRGQIHMQSGRAELTDIVAQQGPGVIRGDGVIDLRQDRRADFSITAENWTYPPGDSPVSVVADANTLLHIDLAAGRVRGQGGFAVRPSVLDKPIGDVRFTAEFDDKTLYLHDIDGRLLDGGVSGRVRFPLRDWMDSRASLQFENLRLGRLPEWQRRLAGLEGDLSAQIEVEQTDDPRRLEPLEILLRSRVVNGSLNGAPIGGLDLDAYAGPNRAIVTDSDLALFSGGIETRARVTKHADTSYIHLTSEIEDISLTDLIRAIDPNAEPVAGLVDGRATLITTPALRSPTFRARLELSESDLINNPIIGTLYRTLAFQFGKTQPEGTGTISLRTEGASLVITSFYYFNRGVEIRGAAEIEDVTLGADSPVSGLVMATTRPLKGIDLPGIKELDKLMGTLQAGAAVVRLEGTAGDVQPKVVPLPEVSSAIRSLLWGQLREEGEQQ